MNVKMIFVCTIDGKVTRWGDPDVKDWSSKEDKEHFKRQWNQARLVVMGSKTFEAETITPSDKRRVIIMTQRVNYYKDQQIPGTIEFSDYSPALLIRQLTEEGYDEMLLVGGAHIATAFFKENLINEIILTIEPKIFGVGGNFVTERNFDIPLKLQSCEQINDNGSLILKYRVIQPETA